MNTGGVLEPNRNFTPWGMWTQGGLNTCKVRGDTLIKISGYGWQSADGGLEVVLPLHTPMPAIQGAIRAAEMTYAAEKKCTMAGATRDAAVPVHALAPDWRRADRRLCRPRPMR